ncbi:MAG: cytochrome c class I [Saprospirales bacterium]|nr:cytochrome c class I [Saprospirales bacterium]
MTNRIQFKIFEASCTSKPRKFLLLSCLLVCIGFVRSAIAQDEELDPQDLSSNEVVSETNEATEGGISDADSIPLDGGGTAENADEAPSGEEALWNQGKVLFQGKCASCHHPIRDGTGPALSGVRQRWIDDGDFQDKSGEEWLYEWIRNNKSVLDAGHPYANNLYKEWGEANMNLFAGLKDDEIDALLYYVDNSAQFEPVAAATDVSAADDGETGGGIGQEFLSKYLIFIGIGLLLLVLILARIQSVLKRIELQKLGQPIPPYVPIWKSKRIYAVLVPLLLFVGAKALMESAIGVGRQQAYQPDQPIAYSHALHAGQLNIECQYCHSGASKSKHSNIPSADVCMNCHMQVNANSEDRGRSEIAKIYASVGWNPNSTGGGSYIAYPESLEADDLDSMYRTYLSQDYSEEELMDDAIQKILTEDVNAVTAMYNSPIPWVRLHNLPDHVYFNHAQHVSAGNVECQSCHGPIQEMEVVYQWSPLSMGWCINCHRNSEVDQTNPYYEQHYHNLADDATVEDIGGTECQKCHY